MPDEGKLVSHYRLKTLLRKDGFGAVYFAEDTRDQKACVLRVIELDHPTLTRITGRVRARAQHDHPLIEQIRQRMKRISELKNSHVLPVIEFGEEHIQGNNDIIFYMVSPYEKESLLSYWSEHTSSAELISLEIVGELIFQAAEGLFYAHRRGLVHQYVRLSSFMLHATARSHKLHLYLTDFWFADISAAILEDGQIAQDLSVYLAAEQLAGHAVAASDQYALAILAYELLLGYRLSQVDLSLGLYERFMLQRGMDVSEADLQLARRVDLVLARALAEDASARYKNIEEFASMFRAVASGEVIELEEDTAKLPAIARSAQSGAEIAAVAAGALMAGEIVEDLTETRAEADDATLTYHPSLHKTVLTAEGMDIAGSEVVDETITSGMASSGTIVEEEETLTVSEEERTRSSGSVVGGAGFAAGLIAGEIFQRETDIFEEQTQIVEGNAAAFAAGEALQREIDRAEERTEAREDSGAGFVVGGAAGLIAGEVLAAEQTQIVPTGGVSAGGAEVYEQESDSADEQTIGEALLADAALEVGELLVGGLVGTEMAGAAGLAEGGLLTDDFAGSQSAGGSTGAGGMSVLEEAEMVGGAAAAGLAAASLATEGSAASGMTQAGNGEASAVGGQSGTSGAGLAGAGLVGGAAQAGSGSGASGGYGGGTGQVGNGGSAGLAGGYAGDTTQAASGSSGLAGAGLLAGGAAGLAGAGGATQAVGAGEIVGGAMQTVGVGGATQAVGGGAVGGGIFSGSSGRRPRRGRTLLAAIIIALLLLLVFGGITAYALGQSSSATVTLTMESHTIQNTYLITASTSTSTTTTSATSGQVQANFLKQIVSQSQSGHVSGYYPGVEASGFIKLTNSATGCGCPTFVPAGTSFVSGSGVPMVIDYGVSVAAQCSVTVPAHAMIYGPGGDVLAGDVHEAYDAHIEATNPFAFSGGQPGQNNALVQQSDIDHLASSLRTQVTQSAQAGLQAQLQSNQRLATQPDCAIKVKPDHAAGDYATSVNVAVTAVCQDEAYDYSSAIQIVQQQVQSEASSYSSDQYTSVNGLQATVASATVTDAKTGTILLAIKVFGKWIEKLSSDMERLIANRSVSDAKTILMHFGAARVDISVSGFNSSTLPGDSSKIKIIVKS